MVETVENAANREYGDDIRRQDQHSSEELRNLRQALPSLAKPRYVGDGSFV